MYGREWYSFQVQTVKIWPVVVYLNFPYVKYIMAEEENKIMLSNI